MQERVDGFPWPGATLSPRMRVSVVKVHGSCVRLRDSFLRDARVAAPRSIGFLFSFFITFLFSLFTFTVRTLKLKPHGTTRKLKPSKVRCRE